jgi:CoA:oxalate CoA-transferase
MSTSEATISRPLEGVLVIDLGQIYNAPYATLLMALAGADVVKIEPPEIGELQRRRKAYGVASAIPFYLLNSNKRSVTLNLKDPRGRDLLFELIDRAAVLVENFRPGTMDRLGVGADAAHQRNPGLIYASGSGYGQDGAYRDLAAMDLTVQAMAGVVASTGFPDETPVRAGPALSDFLGGVHLYGAIVTALYQRTVTGCGATLDVSMLDSVYPSLMSNLGPNIAAAITDAPPPVERTGNRQGGLAESPYNVYPTKDGFITVICLDEAMWCNLLDVMGRKDLLKDPRFSTKAARIAAMDEVDSLVADWTSTKNTDEAFALLRGSGAVCAPVRRLAEVVWDPDLRSRGIVEDSDVPGIGKIPLLHTPLRFVGEERLPLRMAPELGAHNAEVFGDWLGHSGEELRTLQDGGVI